MFQNIQLPYIDPVAFYVLDWPVRWYGLSYLVAFYTCWLAGRFFTNQYLVLQGQKPLETKHFDQLLTVCILGVIIGGRLGHMIFYDFEKMITNPISIFKTWEGGMAFHGGLIGFACCALYYLQKHKLNKWLLADMMCLVAPIGIFFVRIANFINNELIGRQTEFFISVILYNDDIPRHPSQLYEAFFEGIFLFFILFYFYKKQLHTKTEGVLTALFFASYGFFRFMLEYVRLPSDGMMYFLNFSLTYGQVLTLPMIFIGFYIYYRRVLS